MAKINAFTISNDEILQNKLVLMEPFKGIFEQFNPNGTNIILGPRGSGKSLITKSYLTTLPEEQRGIVFSLITEMQKFKSSNIDLETLVEIIMTYHLYKEFFVINPNQDLTDILNLQTELLVVYNNLMGQMNIKKYPFGSIFTKIMNRFKEEHGVEKMIGVFERLDLLNPKEQLQISKYFKFFDQVFVNSADVNYNGNSNFKTIELEHIRDPKVFISIANSRIDFQNQSSNNAVVSVEELLYTDFIKEVLVLTKYDIKILIARLNKIYAAFLKNPEISKVMLNANYLKSVLDYTNNKPIEHHQLTLK